MAAIDTVTLALTRRYRPEALAAIRELGTTYPAPAPPFLVRGDLPKHDVDVIVESLFDRLADSTLMGCKDVLMLKSLDATTRDDYWIIRAFEDHAVKAGYEWIR